MPGPAAKSKIVPFKQDKRLAVAGALRGLALVGMLCTLIYGIWRYQDQLSLQNLRLWSSYLSLVDLNKADFSVYSFETGLDTEYVPFGTGLAVYAGDTYRFVTTLGRGDFSLRLGYGNPVLQASDNSVLIYDRGGTGLSVLNAYSSLMSTQLSSSIISAAVNRSGAFTVVTNETDYRAAVTFYDEKRVEKYKWQTPDFYLMLSAPAPKSDRFAVLCLQEQEGRFSSLIRVYDIRKKDPVFEVDLGDTEVYSLGYLKNGKLIAVTSHGVVFYDSAGEPAGECRVEEGALVRFAHPTEQLPLLITRGQNRNEYLVQAVDEKGEIGYSGTFSGSPRSVDRRGNKLALLFSNALTVVDFSGEEPEVNTATGINARDVRIRDDGRVILTYPDRAELWDAAGGQDE